MTLSHTPHLSMAATVQWTETPIAGFAAVPPGIVVIELRKVVGCLSGA